MPPAGFELTVPASEWLQSHALDRAATGIAIIFILCTSFTNAIADRAGPSSRAVLGVGLRQLAC
jgi:hypothetical protein